MIRSLVPALAVGASFLGAIGLDEWFGVDLVDEAMAGAAGPVTLLLLIIAGVGSSGFAVACARRKR